MLIGLLQSSATRCWINWHPPVQQRRECWTILLGMKPFVPPNSNNTSLDEICQTMQHQYNTNDEIAFKPDTLYWDQSSLKQPFMLSICYSKQ